MDYFFDTWNAVSQSAAFLEITRLPWKFICPSAAIVLVLCCFFIEQLRRYTRRQTLAGVLTAAMLPPLILIALMAFGNYNNFANWRMGSFFNAYEFYHYYMGSKYAPEIHYKDLYSASLIADDETGLKFNHAEKTIKNLNPKWQEMGEPYRISVKQVLQNKEEVKSRFTPERWDEFAKDIKFFKKELVGGRWDGVLRDKGYNGSPAWSTVVGGLLSNNFSTDWRPGMVFLASLDLILIALALCFVTWAYGLRPALLVLVVLGTSYVMSFSHMKGAYLRTDFTVPIIVSMCLVKKNHYASAGALMGYAAVARLFPAVFLFGIGARMFWVSLGELSHAKKNLSDVGFKATALKFLTINKNHIVFFVCVALMVGFMFLVPIVYTGSADLWLSYKDKLADHADDISPWRVGFKYLFIGEMVPQAQHKNLVEGVSFFAEPLKYIDGQIRYWNVITVSKRYNEYKLFWNAIMFFVLAVCLIGARGLKDHDAIAFSFVPCFFLASPTYYYYIMLLIPMLFFAPYLNRPSRLLGAVAMLALAMPGYYLYSIWMQKFPTYYWHSVMYFWLCAYMVLIALYDAIRAFLAGTPHALYEDDREFAKHASQKYAQDNKPELEENRETPEDGDQKSMDALSTPSA